MSLRSGGAQPLLVPQPLATPTPQLKQSLGPRYLPLQRLGFRPIFLDLMIKLSGLQKGQGKARNLPALQRRLGLVHQDWRTRSAHLFPLKPFHPEALMPAAFQSHLKVGSQTLLFRPVWRP